jgi:hypothetical protein
MNADDLTKLTTDALDQRSTALEQGPSENLTALKTRTRFHRYSWLCDPQHSQDCTKPLRGSRQRGRPIEGAPSEFFRRF